MNQTIRGMGLPDPDAVFPNEYGTSCYIKNVVTAPNIQIGDYTYYDDPVDPAGFEQNNVLFNYPEFGDRLIIGKFCSIAAGTQFIMGPANHRTSSVSTYPFQVVRRGMGYQAPPHLASCPERGHHGGQRRVVGRRACPAGGPHRRRRHHCGPLRSGEGCARLYRGGRQSGPRAEAAVPRGSGPVAPGMAVVGPAPGGVGGACRCCATRIWTRCGRTCAVAWEWRSEWLYAKSPGPF